MVLFLYSGIESILTQGIGFNRFYSYQHTNREQYHVLVQPNFFFVPW